MSFSAEDQWRVVDCYFHSYDLARQHVESFNHFVNEGIQSIIREYPPIVSDDVTITFGDVSVSKPFFYEDNTVTPMLPMEARLRNANYSGRLYVDVKVTKPDDNGIVNTTTQKMHIADIPIMLKSDYCHLSSTTRAISNEHAECLYDLGGYFIINGSEKFVVCQERMSWNYIYITRKLDTVVAEIRSLGRNGKISTVYMRYPGNKEKEVSVNIPHIKKELSVPLLLLALGCRYDDIIPLMGVAEHEDDDDANAETNEHVRKILQECIRKSSVINTRTNALRLIGKHFMYDSKSTLTLADIAMDNLKNEFLPHLGNDLRVKIMYVLYITRKLLETHLGKREVDDRDHSGKKRIELTGNLMLDLFKRVYGRLIKEVRAKLKKNSGKRLNLSYIVQHSTITNGLRYALSTGTWSDTRSFAQSKAGVSQILNRYNLLLL